MDLLIISTRFIHTDHLEFPRMYRAWRVNSFQGHETRSKTMHHVKSVTELRIAPTLAAFNWVTRYNLSCSCFNPVFNFPLLSLTLSSFPQILCVTVSFSPFSRFFVGFLAITSREIATRAVSPKTRLQLAEFHPLDDWNERGRGTCFFFFFRRKLLIWPMYSGHFGRCSALLLIFFYRKNPRINGYALVCARILFWCGCNFRGEIFNGRTLGWKRMRGR